MVSQTCELGTCALTTRPEPLAGDPQRSAAYPAFWKWRRWADRGWWLTLCKVVSSAWAAPSWSGGHLAVTKCHPPSQSDGFV